MGSDDGETGLFAGVDGSDTGQEESDPEIDPTAQPAPAPLSPMDYFDRPSHTELLAVLFGAVPWFLAVMLDSAALVTAAVGVVLAAIHGRSSRLGSSVPKYVLREPHYVLAGAGLAWLTASLAVGTASAFAPIMEVLG